MTPRFPSPLSLSDMSLVGSSLGQGSNLMTSHRGASTSDCALTAPASPQTSERSDAVLVKPRRRISFDERVSVREFESNSWISVKDMEQLSPVGMREHNVIPVPKMIVCPKESRLYQDEDLCTEYPMMPGLNGSSSHKPLGLHQLLRREIRTVLVVDPHDIFLSLFSKRLQEALPYAQILTAHSSEEALQLLSKQTFDIIITEERLSLFHRHTSSNKLASGSGLLSYLRTHHARQFQRSLLIGVSAHWQRDHATMAQSGADYCWSKAPPPTLHRTLLEEMTHTLLCKRRERELADDFVCSGASEAGDADNQKQ